MRTEITLKIMENRLNKKYIFDAEYVVVVVIMIVVPIYTCNISASELFRTISRDELTLRHSALKMEKNSAIGIYMCDCMILLM